MYLVLDIGCAECRGSHDPHTLVTVLGYADSLPVARKLTEHADERHNWLGDWAECADGWYAAAGDGELRIVAIPTSPEVEASPGFQDRPSSASVPAPKPRSR